MTEKEMLAMLATRAMLDQLGAELIMRAANLDKLAAQVEAHMIQLEVREHALDIREREVLAAAAEIWGKEADDGLASHH